MFVQGVGRKFKKKVGGDLRKAPLEVVSEQNTYQDNIAEFNSVISGISKEDKIDLEDFFHLMAAVDLGLPNAELVKIFHVNIIN